jgi:MscS family membrane protein
MGIENNLSVATKVADGLNSKVDSVSHDFLILLYQKVPLLAYSVYGITYGQIIVAVLIFLFIFFLRPLLVKLTLNLSLKLAKRTSTKYDDRVIENLKEPLQLTFLLLAFYLFLSVLLIDNRFLNLLLGSLVIFNFFWIVWATICALEGLVFHAVGKLSSDISTSLGGFILRVLKVLIWVVALSSILSLWGINVTALIASLGLGGLAFALAAKDTAANLFGSIAILMDKSIKIGDWVKVDGVEGTVEDIGMRTTKIRSFYKSLIVVPNQIVANSNIENFSRRDKRRIKMSIGLIYSTSSEQLATIAREIRQMLLTHPKIAKDETLLVNFDKFNDSSKDIFIYTFTNTAVWQEYLNIKEDIQYKIEEIVLRNNSGFAYPSQSIFVESLPENSPNLTAKPKQS